MKKIIFSLAFVCASLPSAFASPGAGTGISVTPRMSCRLIKQTLLSVPIWRENGVPQQRINDNVRRAADGAAGFDGVEKGRWMTIAADSYSRKLNSEQIAELFHTDCEQIPASPDDIDYVPKK